MRILFFIDSLFAGGAERQLVTMAVGLKRRGHDLRFLIYHSGGRFLAELEAARIPCICLQQTGRLRRLWEVRRVLRQGWQDVVLAFLEAPCLYSELAGLPCRRWGLVVGERLAHPHTNQGLRRWLSWPHRFADAVVTNSHANRQMVERAWPALHPKLTTIYNAVDLDRFRPSCETVSHRAGSPVHMVVAASYQRKKNMLGLAKAVHLLQQSGERVLVTDWYGAALDPEALNEATAFVNRNRLAPLLRFHPPVTEIEKEYQRADVVGLFSEYEGLPNAVCEGMACGKPILVSDVCDARNLVADSKNGFLCDPHCPESIAKALKRVSALTQAQLQEMGQESRRKAETLFDMPRVLAAYEAVFERCRQIRQSSHAVRPH